MFSGGVERDQWYETSYFSIFGDDLQFLIGYM